MLVETSHEISKSPWKYRPVQTIESTMGFDIPFSDVPEKKTDVVKGVYKLPLKNQKATVVVKIIDYWEKKCRL